MIPSDEIRLKLGGDNGGGYFKMNFQIVNTPILSTIHVFSPDLKQVQSVPQWQHEFLSRMYGHSGASGRNINFKHG